LSRFVIRHPSCFERRLDVLVVMDKKNIVVDVLVVVGACLVDALCEWWWSAAEHSKHAHLQTKSRKTKSLTIHLIVYLLPVVIITRC